MSKSLCSLLEFWVWFVFSAYLGASHSSVLSTLTYSEGLSVFFLISFQALDDKVQFKLAGQ